MQNVRMVSESRQSGTQGGGPTSSFNMRDVGINSESLMRLLFGRAVIGFNMQDVRINSESLS